MIKIEYKPKDVDEYKKWLYKVHNIKITNGTETYYNSVTSAMRKDFENSDLWSEITKEYNNYNDEYLIKTGYPLFMPSFKPILYIKPYQSFLLKTYRKNILDNDNWPNAPVEG